MSLILHLLMYLLFLLPRYWYRQGSCCGTAEEWSGLVKPQFEAGREKVGKKGVVRDPKVHEEVIHKVIDFALKNGFSVHNLSYSPIKGPEGNIEYLVYIEKNSESKKEETIDVDAIVEAAHTSLS